MLSSVSLKYRCLSVVDIDRGWNIESLNGSWNCLFRQSASEIWMFTFVRSIFYVNHHTIYRKFCGIHLTTISQEKLKISIHKISLKITLWKLMTHPPGANGFRQQPTDLHYSTQKFVTYHIWSEIGHSILGNGQYTWRVCNSICLFASALHFMQHFYLWRYICFI